MKTVIIPQKMSSSGSIHDIASQHYDREIKFPEGTQYAVVLADYYGGKGYTTHQTELATMKADKKNGEYSREIIGVDGWIYRIDKSSSYDGELQRDPDQREPYQIVEPNNVKSRHQEILDACHKVIEDQGVDITQKVKTLPLAKMVVEKTDCHINTAKRNVAKAIRQKRGEYTEQWGGGDRGAGRPRKDG